MTKVFLLIFLAFLAGCTGSGDSASNTFGVREDAEININLMSVSPSNKALFVGESVQFSASGGSAPYTFSLSSGIGSVDSSGFYTAPGVAGSAVIQAVDSLGEEAFATVSIAVQISISPTSATIGDGDTLSLSGSGGIPPYMYRIVAGDGSINSSTGLYDATGVSSGSAVIEVRDSSDNTAYSAITINPSLVITPSSQTIGYGEQIAFSASGGDIPYTYSVLTGSGSINAVSGLFVGPSSNGTTVIRVTDNAGNTVDSVVTIVDSPQIDRPRDQVGIERVLTFSATNGSPPYTFSIVSGGGSIVAGTGVFTAPSDSDTTVVQVSDVNGYTDSTSITTFVPKKLALGAEHTCVVDFSDISNSISKCWGRSVNGTAYFGMLGPISNFYLSDDNTELSDNVPTIDLGTSVQVRGVRVGRYSACAVTTDDRLKCFGYNNYGQLGLGDRTSRGYIASQMGNSLEYVDLGTGRTVNNTLAIEDALSINHHTTCVILDDNTTKCFGYGGSGKHGHANGASYSDAASEVGDNLPDVDFGTDYPIQISVGILHTCAVLQDNTLKCWGEGGQGRLGSGNQTDKVQKPKDVPIVDLGTGRTAQKVALGNAFTCALLDNNSIVCFGDNPYGQLGIGSNLDIGDGAGEMGDNLLAVNLGTGKTAVDIAAMYESACAILNDGTVKCWGRNNYGQLGQGSTTTRGDTADELGDSLLTVDLGVGRTATKLYSGLYSVCAKLDNGTFKCWGRNNNATLAQGHRYDIGESALSLGDNLDPIDISSSANITTIQTNEYTSCAVLDNNSLKCWGRDYYGSRGTGDSLIGDEASDMGSSLLTLDHGVHAPFKEIQSELYVTCGLNTDDKLACWSYAGEGGRASGNSTSRGFISDHWGDSLEFVDFGTGLTVKTYDIGYRGGCAILSDDSVACWGTGGYGVNGLGNQNDYGDSATEIGDNFNLTDLGNVSTPVEVSRALWHSCARFANGGVKCWGRNNYGQLGIGNTTQKGDGGGEMGNSLPFVDLGTGRTSTQICTGEYFSCSLLDNDQVKCWGRSIRIGQGTNTDNAGDAGSEMGNNLSTISLGTGRSAEKISCGRYHACAILDDESVKCWGESGSGQTGQGTTNDIGDSPGEMGDNLPAIDLGTGRTALDINAGQNHTCVVLDNNSVKCFGLNSSAQLGLGHTTNMGTLDVTMGDSLPEVDTE